MGHAAFERAQEDREAHQEWLKEEEKLWAEWPPQLISTSNWRIGMARFLNAGEALGRLELIQGR